MSVVSVFRLVNISGMITALIVGLSALAVTDAKAENDHYCYVHEFKGGKPPWASLPPREIDLCKKGDILILVMDEFTYYRHAQTRVAQYCDFNSEIFVNKREKPSHRMACRYIGHRRDQRLPPGHSRRKGS